MEKKLNPIREKLGQQRARASLIPMERLVLNRLMAIGVRSSRLRARSGEGFGEDVWRYDYGSDSWTRLEDDLPLDAKFWHSYSVSGLDGSCTIFGGTNGREFFDETWRYSDGELTRLTTSTHPSSRTLAAMAYDPVNDVTLLFGGLDYASGDSGDLWALGSGGTWVEITGAETSVEETDTGFTGIPGFPMIAILAGLFLIGKILRAKHSTRMYTRMRA